MLKNILKNFELFLYAGILKMLNLYDKCLYIRVMIEILNITQSYDQKRYFEIDDLIVAFSLKIKTHYRFVHPCDRLPLLSDFSFHQFVWIKSKMAH